MATVIGLAVPCLSEAQQSTTRLSSPELRPDGQNTLDLPDSDVRTQYYGQIRLEGMNYLTPLKEAPNLTYSQFLSARLSLLREAPRFDLAADIAAGTFFSAAQSNFFVNEAYASYKTEPVKVYAGRKKEDWSEMDHRWQLGLWQPRQAIDTLRPEEQGLVGVFLDHSTDNFQFLAYGSPIFIPSMGPNVRNENGSLVSDSRWYRTPSSEYNFNNRVNSISYSLDIGDEERLAMNAGGALMSRVGNKEQGAWMVLSAGYKPVNDLILSRKIIKAASQDKVDVTVSPEVTHHAIGSVDIGYSFDDVRVSASYLEDHPDTKLPDPDWAIQKVLPLKAYSAAVDFSMDNMFFSRSLAFEFSYLKVDGGGIVDILNDGSRDDLTLFDSRMQFTNAVSAQVEGQLALLFRRPLVTRLKYLYDYDQKGSLINAEFLYYPSQKWALVMGADVLGVEDENYRPDSFLNEFRANDRVYGGMTYVF
jgi:hypothetical protein